MNGSKLIEDKYRAWKKYSYSCKREDYVNYCKICNTVTSCVKYSKKMFEKGFASDIKSNPKCFWKFVCQKTQIISCIGNLKDRTGNWISDDKQKAENFNSFFTPVFNINESDSLPLFEPRLDSSVCDILVTIECVKKLLSSVSISKSVGQDEIHPRVLKETADSLALLVMILFNKSLSSGEIPDEWHLANVSTIFKSGDKAKSCNYGPISITSILCRHLETVVKEAFMRHCEDNNLFPDCQFGFRKKQRLYSSTLESF